jgi:hypothetical protein
MKPEPSMNGLAGDVIAPGNLGQRLACTMFADKMLGRKAPGNWRSCLIASIGIGSRVPAIPQVLLAREERGAP